MRRRACALLALCVLTLPAACGGGGGGNGGSSSAPASRAQTMADLADKTIVPRYEALEAPMAALLAAIEAVCATPSSTTLAAAQTALADARRAWKSLEAMWVGPVRVRRSWTLMDAPVDPDLIEELIAGSEPSTFDAGYIAERVGSNQRGMRAIEYVIGGDDSSLDTLSGRRCEYLVSVAMVIRDHAALLGRDWSEGFNGGKSYRDLVVDPDNLTNFDTLITDIVYLLKEMTADELGMALGLLGDPNAAAIIEGEAGLGVGDLQGRMAGIRAVLVGDDAAKGVAPMLGEDLATRLRAQLDAADQALAAVKPPLLQAIVIHHDEVQNARGAIQAVEVTVDTEVVSKLGVTLGFRGNDGDSGG